MKELKDEEMFYIKIDYLVEWDVLDKREMLGDDKFIDFIASIIEHKNSIFDNEVLSIWLSSILELSNKTTHASKYWLEILKIYKSWLAYSMLAGQYLEENNFENAPKNIHLSNEIILEDINDAREGAKQNKAYNYVLENYIISYSNNIRYETECYYFSGRIEKCISFCQNVLNNSDETLLLITKFHIYFFLSLCNSNLGRYNEALDKINEAIKSESYRDKELEEPAIRQKLYLLEKLKKFEEKLSFLNNLSQTHLELYVRYSFQIKRLRKQQEQNELEENEELDELIKPVIEKSISRRLLGEISHTGNQFTSEKLMEAFIVSFIDNGDPVFGRHFKIYEDYNLYGRQYKIKNGYIDLLLVDNETNDLYIVELKKDKDYNNPKDQINYYRDYVIEKVAKGDQKVYCILCLKDCDNKLKDEINKLENTFLYTYDFIFKQEK